MMNAGKQIPAIPTDLIWNRFPSWSELEPLIATSSSASLRSLKDTPKQWLFWQLRNRSTPLAPDFDWAIISITLPIRHATSSVDTSPTQSTERQTIDVRVASARGEVWCALALEGWDVVAGLLHEHGMPPQPVVADWRAQSKIGALVNEVEAVDIPVSHLLVARNGYLQKLSDLNQWIAHHVQTDHSNWSVSGDQMEQSHSLPKIEFIQAQANQCELAENRFAEKSLNQILNLNGKFDASSQVADAPAEEDALSNSAHSVKEESGSSAKSPLAHGNRKEDSKKLLRSSSGLKSGTLLGAIGLLALISAGVWFWFVGAGGQGAAISKSPDKLSLPATEAIIGNANVKSHAEKQINKGESAAKDINTSSDLASMDQEELVLNGFDGKIEKPQAELGAKADDLMSQLTDSISVKGTVDGSKDTDSVAEFLRLLQEPTEPVVGDVVNGDKAKRADSGSPFDEPINEPGDGLNDEPMKAGESDNANEKVIKGAEGSEEKLEQSYLNATWVFEKLPWKTTYRMPFAEIDKLSACRVRLDLPDDMIVKPVDAVIVIGKRDVSWTVALDDDSASLEVYLRSKPGRNWTLQGAVQLRFEDGNYIPIVPGQTSRYRQQLESMLINLDAQSEMLSSLRSSPRDRTMVAQIKPAVDKKRKELEKSIKQWTKIDELANAFFQTHQWQITFASDEQSLPVKIAGETEPAIEPDAK